MIIQFFMTNFNIVNAIMFSIWHFKSLNLAALNANMNFYFYLLSSLLGLSGLGNSLLGLFLTGTWLFTL